MDTTNESADFEQISDSLKAIDQSLDSIDAEVNKPNTSNSSVSEDDFEIVNSCHKAKDQGGFILKSNTSIGDFVLMRNNE